jgi:hypothetical protein
MKGDNYAWHQRFRELYDKALVKYRNENRNVNTFFTPREVGVLRAFGAKPMELFDYAEDSSDLDSETALLIIAARRDYFFEVQKGAWSEKEINTDQFPAKEAELNGIAWLPRLIEKAKARLRGEMPNDLMYGCRGDRRFFRAYDVHPADFLRLVWAAKGNEQKILAYIKGER